LKVEGKVASNQTSVTKYEKTKKGSGIEEKSH